MLRAATLFLKNSKPVKFMNHNDPYNLQRFVEAQSRCYQSVCAELKAGRKLTHWMWFIFPQWKGLGYSSVATFYAISSRPEAAAFLAHPILGSRLMECTRLVNAVKGRPVDQIFGDPDNLKFRSSMTLFAEVAVENQVFLQALQKFFNGEPDQLTLTLMKRDALG